MTHAISAAACYLAHRGCDGTTVSFRLELSHDTSNHGFDVTTGSFWPRLSFDDVAIASGARRTGLHRPLPAVPRRFVRFRVLYLFVNFLCPARRPLFRDLFGVKQGMELSELGRRVMKSSVL